MLANEFNTIEDSLDVIDTVDAMIKHLQLMREDLVDTHHLPETNKMSFELRLTGFETVSELFTNYTTQFKEKR